MWLSGADGYENMPLYTKLKTIQTNPDGPLVKMAEWVNIVFASYYYHIKITFKLQNNLH